MYVCGKAKYMKIFYFDLTKGITIHLHEGTMNVCIEFHGNPSMTDHHFHPYSHGASMAINIA